MLPPTPRTTVNAVITLLQETDLSIRRIADKIGVDSMTIIRISRRELGQVFHDRRKQRLADTRSTRSIAKCGYVYVPAPTWWKGTRRGGNGSHAREHHVVYCEANNLTFVPDGCVVHHINHNKLDNRLENLQLMSNGEHTRYHNLNPNAPR